MSNTPNTIGTLNASTQGALSATALSTQRNFGVELWCTNGIRSGVLVFGVDLGQLGSDLSLHVVLDLLDRGRFFGRLLVSHFLGFFFDSSPSRTSPSGK